MKIFFSPMNTSVQMKILFACLTVVIGFRCILAQENSTQKIGVALEIDDGKVKEEANLTSSDAENKTHSSNPDKEDGIPTKDDGLSLFFGPMHTGKKTPHGSSVEKEPEKKRFQFKHFPKGHHKHAATPFHVKDKNDASWTKFQRPPFHKSKGAANYWSGKRHPPQQWWTQQKHTFEPHYMNNFHRFGPRPQWHPFPPHRGHGIAHIYHIIHKFPLSNGLGDANHNSGSDKPNATAEMGAPGGENPKLPNDMKDGGQAMNDSVTPDLPDANFTAGENTDKNSTSGKDHEADEVKYHVIHEIFRFNPGQPYQPYFPHWTGYPFALPEERDPLAKFHKDGKMKTQPKEKNPGQLEGGPWRSQIREIFRKRYGGAPPYTHFSRYEYEKESRPFSPPRNDQRVQSYEIRGDSMNANYAGRLDLPSHRRMLQYF